MTHKIDRLGHQGDGIAAGPVFVATALPGEIVEGDVENGRIAQPKILTPSPDRVRPPCRHFKSCGGCALQHASDAFVENWKADVVRQAVAAHGLQAPITGVVTSAAQSRRRASLSGRRTKKSAIIGFHGRAAGTIVEIPDCQLLHPDLIATFSALRELTTIGASRKGEISLAVTRSEGGVDVIVSGGKPLDGGLRVSLAALAERHKFARLTWGDELLAQRTAPTQLFADVAVTPPAGAFLQATKDGEIALLSAVQRAVGPADRVVDLFSGCGTFALPLARDAQVHCVEGEATMLAALDAGWRLASGLKKITTETRDLFRRPLLADELNKFTAAVIDPPRAGAKAQFEQLAQASVTKIAAVSCNPVTFAKDAKILTDAGYQIDWIEIIDQFRWSPHIELVAAITKA